MIKQLTCAVCLAIPMAAFAADQAPAAAAPAAKPAVVTPAQARAVQQTRNLKMSACTKEAADKGLQGEERKLYVGKCVNAQ